MGVVSDDGGLHCFTIDEKNRCEKISKLRTFKGTMYVKENEGKEFGYLVGIH